MNSRPYGLSPVGEYADDYANCTVNSGVSQPQSMSDEVGSVDSSNPVQDWR